MPTGQLRSYLLSESALDRSLVLAAPVVDGVLDQVLMIALDVVPVAGRAPLAPAAAAHDCFALETEQSRQPRLELRFVTTHVVTYTVRSASQIQLDCVSFEFGR